MKHYLQKKRRVRSLEEVAATIKTVEKLAASVLTGAKERYESLSMYENYLEAALNDLRRMAPPSSEHVSPGAPTLALVVTGNKGLVGNLYTSVLANTATLQASSVIRVGTKGTMPGKLPIMSHVAMPENITGVLELAETLTEQIGQLLDTNKIGRVVALYPGFTSFLIQTASQYQIFPGGQATVAPPLDTPARSPIFEPRRQQVHQGLQTMWLKVALAKVLIEAKLAEVAARLLTAQQASDHAQAIILQAKKDYFKARRAEITAGQLESFVGHLHN